MTTISSYKDVSHAVLGSLRELKSYGNEITVRDMTTRELLGHSFRVTNPLARFTLLPHRKCNPFAQIAETLWMLAGRNDLDWLETYIPSCKKWSDDGKTWRDAYGPRLRLHGHTYELLSGKKYPVGAVTDQLNNVIQKLQQDIHTRQAVMTIWNPQLDWVENSKTYPCNIALQFMVRENKLHMFVTVRSNDVIYGFSHNDFFSWSILHQMMAHWIGVELGSLHWNAASFHIYERHYDLADKIIYDTHPRMFLYDYDVPTLPFTTPFEHFDVNLAKLFEEVHYTGRNHIDSDLSIGTFSDDAFLDSCTKMLMLYNTYKYNIVWDVDDIISIVANIPTSDFRIAAIDYLCRDSRFKLDDFVHLLEGDDSIYTYLENIQHCQE